MTDKSNIASIACDLGNVEAEAQELSDLLELLYEHIEDESKQLTEGWQATAFSRRVELFLSLLHAAERLAWDQRDAIDAAANKLYAVAKEAGSDE